MTTDETLDHHAEVSAAVGLFVMHVVVVSKSLLDREALPVYAGLLPLRTLAQTSVNTVQSSTNA